jgi:biotin transport system permease protein
LISLYIAKTTWLHRIPAGMKLFALLVASIAILPIQNPILITIGCGLIALVYLSFGRVGFERLIGLRAILLLVFGLGIFQGLLMNWQIAWLSVTRLLLMVMIADLVSATTPMQDIMRVVRPVLLPLQFVGLNPDRLSLAVALVIRYIPLLLAQWQAQSAAWNARSKRRPGLRLIPPFMTLTMNRTDKIADAITARKQRREH